MVMSNSGPKEASSVSSRRPSRRFSSTTRDQQRDSDSPSGSFAIPTRKSGDVSEAVSGVNSPIAGSFQSREGIDMDNPDPKLVKTVKRHLVPEEQPFDSLQLQSGDITREIYNWQREHATEEGQVKRGRSRSFGGQPEILPEVGQARDMLVPGGFRRDYIATHDAESIRSGSNGYGGVGGGTASSTNSTGGDPERQSLVSAYTEAPVGRDQQIFTRNFIEFLSLYGHFAGEELEELSDEDEDEDDEDADEDNGQNTSTERTALLRGQRHGQRQQQRTSHQQAKGQASTTETVMLLLKSFVGTGVLFLPRAFYNGGLAFSSIVLTLVSIISYWCFLLLIAAKEHANVSSFGDIGGALYGDSMRKLILRSIVVSQIGFASAYIVFVAENLRSFVSNVHAAAVEDGSGKLVSISTLIVLQLVVFLPLSMIRDIAKMGFTALIADAFILAGLVYLYSWSGVKLLTEGVADVAMFNSSKWTLFIGTAVFTFEGIGLIIPIQESMREPRKFGTVLASVMVGITVIFVSVGALLYMATGSSVETVILLNLPRGELTNTVQLLYSLAILLSTPLQLFPAIRILENGLFVRSGKYNRKVKWQKNIFRFLLVIATGVVAYFGADDLDKFVALIGSVACVPLVYIYPPLLHMKVVPQGSRAYYYDVALGLFGLAIMAYTSFTTAKSWVLN